MRRSILTLAAAGALVAVAVSPASAKSISRIGASCSAGTAGYGIFMEQGSRVTLGFGASGTGASGTWHTSIVDNGTTTILDYTGATGSAWSVSTTKTLPRGVHAVSIRSDNLVSGESCSLNLSFKN